MDQGVAAVWAAVIGVGGALLGTAGGAWTGGRAARVGARVQSKVNFHEWLRQQQRVTYAEMHTAASETLRLGHAFARGGPPHQAALDESLYKLVRAGSTVSMVGPESMHELARNLVNAAYAMPGSSPDVPDWTKWTKNVVTVLTMFTNEASKVISAPPALT
jgi:hypothetical protein